MLSPGCFAPEEFALQNRYFRPDKLIDNVELEKVENLKKALGAGTYDVHAEQVAGRSATRWGFARWRSAWTLPQRAGNINQRPRRLSPLTT